MFDTSKLRGRIFEKFGSQNAFARAIKRSDSFVSQVLHGWIYLDQKSIDLWAEKLDISVEDYPAYFFTKKVHETEQG